MRFKEILENRYGYDDSGMSLAPGHDEGEDSWDYSAAHDIIGAGDPRKHRYGAGYPRKHRQYQADVPHDVHINGKKWKTFGSHGHASNVAKKIKGATVHRSMDESATAGATSSASIASVANPTLAKSKKPVKSVDALDQNVVSLFGGPMESSKAPIIKRR
jgi:hypothetical protein